MLWELVSDRMVSRLGHAFACRESSPDKTGTRAGRCVVAVATPEFLLGHEICERSEVLEFHLAGWTRKKVILPAGGGLFKLSV